PHASEHHLSADISRLPRVYSGLARNPALCQFLRTVVRGTRSAGRGELRPARLAHARHDARLEPRVDDSRRDEVADNRAELDENSASGPCGVSGREGPPLDVLVPLQVIVDDLPAN